MTWREASLTLQRLAEERIGAARRQAAARDEAEMDAAWARAREQLVN